MYKILIDDYKINVGENTYVFCLEKSPIFLPATRMFFDRVLYNNFVYKTGLRDSYATNVNKFPYIMYNGCVYSLDKTKLHFGFVTKDGWETGEIVISQEFNDFLDNHYPERKEMFYKHLTLKVFYNFPNNSSSLPKSSNTRFTNGFDAEYQTLYPRIICPKDIFEYLALAPLPEIKFTSLKDVNNFDLVVKQFLSGPIEIKSHAVIVEQTQEEREMLSRLLNESPILEEVVSTTAVESSNEDSDDYW